MKRTKSKTFGRKYPRRQAHQQDAGTLIARRAIVRALRKEGMHRVLKGTMATIGFVMPDTINRKWIHHAAMDLLRDLSPKRDVNHLMYDTGVGRTSKGTVDGGIGTIAQSHILFGFATDEKQFPEDFRIAADCIVTIDNVDVEAIDAAFRAVMNVNAPRETVEAALHLPDGLISGVIKRGRRLQDVTRTLTRPKPETKADRALPSIDDLSGYGDAVVWAKALMADLKSYGIGDIEWEDVDRGALISGPSGTGKTYFAQVLAASCNVPLHAHSLMQWQAKGHLGDLLAAMRKAFDAAVKAAPCILFLDEFDAFGSRDSFGREHAQYCSEVVNGLLECLDGVGKRPGVVVIGATNFPERIDPALLRPGRLGRHLKIELPDLISRIGILRHHLGDAMPGIELSGIAGGLDGASGAVLEQVVRDARRRARTAKREIEPSDLQSAMPARIRLTDDAFRRTCIHEAGHLLVGNELRIEAHATPNEVKVFREIDPSRGDSGHTAFDHVRGADRTRQTYEASIATVLAGIAAEKVLLGNHGDSGGGGPGCDLHRASVLAAGLVVSYGLDGSLAWIGCSTHEQIIERLRFDGRLRRRVDAILQECFNRAERILTQNKRRLEALARTLSQHRTITARDIERVGDPENVASLPEEL